MSSPSALDRRCFWPVSLLMLAWTALAIVFLHYLSFGAGVSLTGFLQSIPLMLRHQPQILVLILVCFLLTWMSYALVTLGAVGPQGRTDGGAGEPGRPGGEGPDRATAEQAAPRRTVVVHIDPITAMTAEERGQAAQVLGIPWRTELRDDDRAWGTAYESALAQLRPRR
jgi:hypothetical protein